MKVKVQERRDPIVGRPCSYLLDNITFLWYFFKTRRKDQGRKSLVLYLIRSDLCGESNFSIRILRTRH
jgi:hypothetical protein